MIRVDEPVAVELNRSGEPVGFSWRDGKYRVISRPERWFSRRNWWDESARAQRGIGAGVLEVEMWRLSATKESALPAQFELIHTQLDGNWQLVRIFG
jgi:hypothetical protein